MGAMRIGGTTINFLKLKPKDLVDNELKQATGGDSQTKGLARIRIGLFCSLCLHLILFAITLGFGVPADKRLKHTWQMTLGFNTLGDSYTEVDNLSHYYFPIAAGTSGFFAITAGFNLMELIASYRPVYSTWLTHRLTPITWFEFAVSDAYLSALFIMLNGIGEVGSIFQHAMLRAIMNLCGWLAEHENFNAAQPPLIAPEGQTLPSFRVKYRSFLVGCLAYLTTLAVRWAYFIIGARTVPLPPFVWAAFAGYHIEIFFPILMLLSFHRLWLFSNYSNYKLSLLVVSMMVKAMVGLTVAIGAFARA